MHPSSVNSPLNQISPSPAWAHAGGEESAVVLSTRVRIARNLKGELFPYRMDTDGRIRVMRAAARAIASLSMSGEGVFFSLAALAPVEIALLMERRTISPQLARDDKPRGVFAWKEADRAVMVCEEDHIRLTDIVPGVAPKKAHENLLPVLQELSSSLEFVSDNALGFLTACPANLGAAVRTSLFCHLPALVLTGSVEDLVSHAADAGFTLRGFWGEASEVHGSMFQLTDGPGLSHQASDMLSRIESLGQEVTEREALARIALQTERPALLKDKIARALAILQVCQALTGAETLALFSAIRLGVDIGFIEGLSRDTISLLTFELGRSYLTWTGESDGTPDQRQVRRAARAREVFATARFAG
jgi:protein arginine kinase